MHHNISAKYIMRQRQSRTDISDIPALSCVSQIQVSSLTPTKSYRSDVPLNRIRNVSSKNSPFPIYCISLSKLLCIQNRMDSRCGIRCQFQLRTSNNPVDNLQDVWIHANEQNTEANRSQHVTKPCLARRVSLTSIRVVVHAKICNDRLIKNEFHNESSRYNETE